MPAPECAAADYCCDRPTVRRPTSAIATSEPSQGPDVGVVLCHVSDPAVEVNRTIAFACRGVGRPWIRRSSAPLAVSVAFPGPSAGPRELLDPYDRPGVPALATRRPLLVQTSSVVECRGRGWSPRRSGSRRAPAARPAVACSFTPGAVTSAARIASLRHAYSGHGGSVAASLRVREREHRRPGLGSAACRSGESRLAQAPWG
jgi:hypothetical protein